MRITALISFFFLLALTTQSQTTIFNGSFSIREITGSSPSYTVDGFFQSEGTYIGTDIQEGDRIYFWHGNDCDYLVVDTVYYAYANIVNLGLSDPDTTFLSIPTGKGLMTRLTDYYNFSIPFTADVPDVLKKCVGGKLINEIDQIRPQTSFSADSIFLDTTGLTYINDTVLQVALEQIDSALFDINDSLDSIPRGTGTTNTFPIWTSSTALGNSQFTWNPTYSRFEFGGTGAIVLPNRTTAQRSSVPTQGEKGWNTTSTGIDFYNGTRWAYIPESTVPRFTSTRIPYADANGQLTEDADITFYESTNRLGVGLGGIAPSYGLHVRTSSSGTTNALRLDNNNGFLNITFNGDQATMAGSNSSTGIIFGSNITIGYGFSVRVASGSTAAFKSPNNRPGGFVDELNDITGTRIFRWNFSETSFKTANVRAPFVFALPSRHQSWGLGSSGIIAGMEINQAIHADFDNQTLKAAILTPNFTANAHTGLTTIGLHYNATNPSATHYGLLIENGQVGFGTITPSAKLDIVGDLEVSSRTGTATSLGGWAADNKSADVVIGSGLSLSGGTLSATGSYTGFTPAADSGSGSNISSGGTLTLSGGYGINTSVSGTTVTIESDTSQLATQYDLTQLVTVDSVWFITTIADTTTLVNAQMGNHAIVEDECNATYILTSQGWMLNQEAENPDVTLTFDTSYVASENYLEFNFGSSDFGGWTSGDTVIITDITYNGVSVLTSDYTFIRDECNATTDQAKLTALGLDLKAGLESQGVLFDDNNFSAFGLVICGSNLLNFSMGIGLNVSSTDTLIIYYEKDAVPGEILKEGGDLIQTDDIVHHIYSYEGDHFTNIEIVNADAYVSIIDATTINIFGLESNTTLNVAKIIFSNDCGQEQAFTYFVNNTTSELKEGLGQVWYVSPQGNDTKGIKGDALHPLQTISAAMDSVISTQDLIYVLPGTYSLSSDTIVGKRLFISKGAAVTASIRSGNIYGDGFITINALPQSISDKITLAVDSISFNANLTLGGEVNVTSRHFTSTNITDNGRETKILRVRSQQIRNLQIGHYHASQGISNAKYELECDELNVATDLFFVGNGTNAAAIDSNTWVVRTKVLTFSNSTSKPFYFEGGAFSSFKNNYIELTADYYYGTNQVFGNNAYGTIVQANGSTSKIKFNVGLWHYTGTSTNGLFGMTNGRFGGLTPEFEISGTFRSDSTYIFGLASGTLSSGFLFKNAKFEVVKSGVSIFSIPTLNTSTYRSLRLLDCEMRNDGSAAKIVISTPTTTIKGNYYDLNGNYKVFLDYGANNRSADDLSATRAGLVLAPSTNGTIHETGGVLFTMIQSDTVTNTASETSLISTTKGSTTLASDYLEQGRDVQCEAWGTVTTNGSPPSLELKLKLGSTDVWESGSFSMIDLSAGVETWHSIVSFTTYTSGSSGTVMPAGEFSFSVGGDPSFGKIARPVYASPVTVNTTTSQAIDFTATWGSADPNASIVMTKFVCKAQN